MRDSLSPSDQLNLVDSSDADRARDGTTPRRGLAVTAGVVAATAYGGAVGLMAGVVSLGAELEQRLPFASPVFGGIALALVVGVPFTLVANAAWRGSSRTDQLSLASGAMLIGWIVVEYLFIRELELLPPSLPRDRHRFRRLGGESRVDSRDLRPFTPWSGAWMIDAWARPRTTRSTTRDSRC